MHVARKASGRGGRRGGSRSAPARPCLPFVSAAEGDDALLQGFWERSERELGHVGQTQTHKHKLLPLVVLAAACKRGAWSRAEKTSVRVDVNHTQLTTDNYVDLILTHRDAGCSARLRENSGC